MVILLIIIGVTGLFFFSTGTRSTESKVSNPSITLKNMRINAVSISIQHILPPKDSVFIV